MRRSLALSVLIVTSWSYVAALDCEMGAADASSPGPAPGVAAIPARAVDRSGAEGPLEDHASHAAHHGADDAQPQGRTSSTDHSHRDGGAERCLMVMTCGLVTSAPSAPPAIREMATHVKRVFAASTPKPDMAVTALDPPPPRRSV